MSLFDIAEKKQEIESLEAKTLEQDFWNDSKESGKVLAKIKSLKDIVSNYYKIYDEVVNLIEMTDLVMTDFDDDLKKEILSNTKIASDIVEKL